MTFDPKNYVPNTYNHYNQTAEWHKKDSKHLDFKDYTNMVLGDLMRKGEKNSVQSKLSNRLSVEFPQTTARNFHPFNSQNSFIGGGDKSDFIVKK